MAMRIGLTYGDTEVGIEVDESYHPEVLKDLVARAVEAFISALTVVGRLVDGEPQIDGEVAEEG